MPMENVLVLTNLRKEFPLPKGCHLLSWRLPEKLCTVFVRNGMRFFIFGGNCCTLSCSLFFWLLFPWFFYRSRYLSTRKVAGNRFWKFSGNDNSRQRHTWEIVSTIVANEKQRTLERETDEMDRFQFRSQAFTLWFQIPNNSEIQFIRFVVYCSLLVATPSQFCSRLVTCWVHQIILSQRASHRNSIPCSDSQKKNILACLHASVGVPGPSFILIYTVNIYFQL